MFTAKNYQSLLLQFANTLPSFSVINGDGQLLFSKDSATDCLTTTRLVAFQIVKKYLKPKPFDLIILNDPENGGFSLTKIIFVSALGENLYLVWEKDLPLIDFKIPPTPLYENNHKNSFVWTALVDGHPQATLLKSFFETEKIHLDQIYSNRESIQMLGQPKNQMLWLKTSQEIFENQFSSKPHGSAECSYRLSPTQMIKLKLLIEERQNIRLITLDFTNTSLASEYSASSHVIESGLIQKLVQFYQIENFFSQAVLDKIKIILPPKSIVSKAHPRGEWNNEIQSICSQLCAFDIAQLNAQSRKGALAFELAPELKFEVITTKGRNPVSLEPHLATMDGLEDLVDENQIDLLECHRSEQHVHLKFELRENAQARLQIKTKLFTENKDHIFKINNVDVTSRSSMLKPKDQVQILWKVN